MNVFFKTLNEIMDSLKSYVDKFKCLVCKDVIKAQLNGENRAAGVEDSPHREGFLLVTLWLLGERKPLWLDYNVHFAAKDMIINDKLHKKGEIIRHPYAEMSTSADQIYPFLLGLMLHGHESANPFYRRLRNRLFKCHNGNYIPPMYIATLIRAYNPETILGKFFYYITLPFKYILLNILDLFLILYLMVMMGSLGRAFYWCYCSVMKLLGKEPGRSPFGDKVEWNGKEVYMGSETLKIQPFIAIEVGSKSYPTPFIKVAKWLYYEVYGDVQGIFTRYFEGTIYKIDKRYNPPVHELINYYLDFKKK